MTPYIAIFNHSENLLTLFREVLQKYGYRVTTHLQELTTLDDIKQMNPDLIILGYFQGYVENEIEVIRALRAEPATALIPIVVCTTGPLRLEKFEDDENIPYLEIVEKPFNVSRLMDGIHAALGEKPKVST